MSITTEITRLTMARNTIRAKGVELGISLSTDTLDQLATEFEGIENRGSVSASVQEGETYTIPKGYHNGSGTVSGVSGGGNYTLQSKAVTPTKLQQNVVPDSGYYGLSDVTVAAIPETYQDVSGVTAGTGDVLANKFIVNSMGQTVAGTMVNNGTVSKTLDADTPSYTIPQGYHSGTGAVSITVEEKSVTPAKTSQTVTPALGSVLSQVEVAAIPDKYVDSTGATAAAGDILAGKTAFIGGNDAEGNAIGVEVTGTMVSNGDVSADFDGMTVASVAIPAGYTTGGTVSLTNDIETALAGI